VVSDGTEETCNAASVRGLHPGDEGTEIYGRGGQVHQR
jgi:hypothetical protein